MNAGPKRVPGLNEVVPSYGAPNMTMSASSYAASHAMYASICVFDIA